MQADAMTILRQVGDQLDEDLYPQVHDGGIVQPGDVTLSCSNQGKEKSSVASRQRRPSARPWQGPPGRQRQAFRFRSSRAATPVVCADIQKKYEAELDAVLEAYPDTNIWHRAEGMWLLTESILLHGLGKKATFLISIPYFQKFTVKSWGFWITPISFEWIGPRHTNYPDGSICAFEPQDKTWMNGDSIVTLLDLYSLWALRHLYLEIYGRWPGYQSIPYPYERLTEICDNEYCGCAHSNRLYVDCCKRHDLARDKTTDALDFLKKSGGLRNPPKEILEFIRYRKFIGDKEQPPNIINFLL